MTSRERMLKTLKHEPVDRAPVAAYIDGLYAEHVNQSFDFDRMRAAFKLQSELGFDVLLRDVRVPRSSAPSENWRVERERTPIPGGNDDFTTIHTPKRTLTQKYRSHERKPGQLPSYATTEPIVKDSADFDAYIEFEPESRVDTLAGIDEARALVGESGLIMTDIGGEFNSAVGLRGVENLLLDALTDPSFYHAQLAFQVGKSKRFIDELSKNPTDLVRHYDNEANGMIIDDRFYRKFVLPYVQEVVMYAEQKGLRVLLHNCGTMGKLLDCYPETGATAIESFTPPPSGDADALRALRVLHRKMVRIGGIDQIHLLKLKDKTVIRAEVTKMVMGLKGDCGYIACHADQLDRDVPLENILLYRDTALMCAQYTR